jgi:hypothetical protein
MGEKFSVKIALKDVLKNAQGLPGEALVFQIQADGGVMVFLERGH